MPWLATYTEQYVVDFTFAPDGLGLGLLPRRLFAFDGALWATLRARCRARACKGLRSAVCPFAVPRSDGANCHIEHMGYAPKVAHDMAVPYM